MNPHRRDTPITTEERLEALISLLEQQGICNRIDVLRRVDEHRATRNQSTLAMEEDR